MGKTVEEIKTKKLFLSVKERRTFTDLHVQITIN
jgi:hypothetical protein